MKNNFIMFCKTYAGDFDRVGIMLETFHKHNNDNILMLLSVPANDMELFAKYNNKNIKIITDESYAKTYFSEEKYHGLSVGYINQEICKLAFWEADLCENYLCIDSDTQFIRDFYVSNFMFDKTTPYTVLVMDKDLSVEKHYQNFWNWRKGFVKKIYDEIELNDPRQRTCHNTQVFNTKVLESLKSDFMDKKEYDYKKLIEISPYEFTWYNVWFQKCGLIKEIAVEPFIKMFHMRIDYIFSRLKLLKEQDLAKAYVGIILNSNWKGGNIPQKYQKPNWIMKKFYKLIRRM